VQFKDKNLAAKQFAYLGVDTLLVTSVFYTVQGEGPFSGVPAVFVRLSGCNRGAKIDCPWCDTNFLVKEGKPMTHDEIIDKIESYKNPNSLDKPLVVFTGGEPLLQEPALNPLTEKLVRGGYKVQLETNGDLLRLSSVPRATVVMSPKVSPRARKYSTPHKEALERADYLKFLVEAKESLYHDLPEYVFEFADRKGSYNVYISPISEYQRDIQPGEVASMWTGLYRHDIAQANHKHAAELTLKYGFRLSIQAHLFASME
jgi:organic radical activating enzyme